MKLTKEKSITMLKGWEMVQEHNKNCDNKVSREKFVDAYFETLLERKEFCLNCVLCNECPCK